MSPFARAACYINELVQQEATNKPLWKEAANAPLLHIVKEQTTSITIKNERKLWMQFCHTR